MENNQSEEGFLAYLFSVGRNSVVLGLDSLGGLDSEGNENRSPFAKHRAEKLLEVLEHLDRHARPIATWEQFYQWLGRGHGWAFFPCESVQKLVPHWFSEDSRIACQQLQDESGNALVGAPFVDMKMIGTGLTEEAQTLLQRGWEEMTGDSDNLGEIYTMQIKSNMVITEQRLFVE